MIMDYLQCHVSNLCASLERHVSNLYARYLYVPYHQSTMSELDDGKKTLSLCVCLKYVYKGESNY